jgi:two-component system response regulator HupR/HoxA
MPNRTWTILVIEAQLPAQGQIAGCLGDDYRVLTAGSGHSALEILKCEEIDLVLCDQSLPDMTGVEFFSQIRIGSPEAIRVLLTECRDPDEVIRSINEAAVYQIISKAWQSDQLRLLIRRALESRELARLHRYLSRELKFADEVLRQQNRKMTKQLQSAYEFDKLVFASDSMMEVCNLARRAAATDLPVLIQGETGTGKELMARAVHFFSGRNKYPFLAQNCAALPDELLHSELFGHKRGAFTGAISDRLGLFAAADGGTVFLDEIGDVSAAFQVSLLRLLQDGEVKPLGSQAAKLTNVRIIAATNQRLKELVDQGRFRRDLYFRLRGFELSLPPLRDRVEDIAILAEHAASKYARSINRKIAGVSAEVLRRLRLHPFPGNVRELENEVRRMVALAADGEFLSLKHMSPEFARLNPEHRADTRIPGLLKDGSTLKGKVEALEAHLVSEALLHHKWNHSRAARELGISRVGLANKIKRYNLDRGATHDAIGATVHGRAGAAYVRRRA